MVARFVRDEEAAGSNPVFPTKKGLFLACAENNPFYFVLIIGKRGLDMSKTNDSKIKNYLKKYPAIDIFGFWGIILIIIIFILSTIFSTEISHFWNNIFHNNVKNTISNSIPIPSPIPTLTMLNVNPDIKIEPEYPKFDEMVTISIIAEINPEEYDVYVSFADENGEFKNYDSTLRCKTDYINGRWVLYKKFADNTYYRIEVDKTTGNNIYKSEMYSINLLVYDGVPYDYTTEEYKEGTTYKDNLTGFTFCASTIYNSFAAVSITFPDGNQKKDNYYPGHTWDFSYQGIKYRATFFEMNDAKKTYKINIRQLVN